MIKKIYFLVFIILGLINNLFAQDEERLAILDSLVKCVDAKEQNNQKLEILDIICQEKFNADTTYKYANLMHSIAQKSMNKAMIVRSLRYLAECEYNNEDYDKTMDILTNELIPMAESENCLVDLGMSYVLFGNCISYTKKGSSGNLWYDKGIDVFRALKDYKKIIWAFNIKATTYIEDGLLDYAQTYLDSSMKYAEIIKDEFSYADIHYYQGYLLSYDPNSTVEERNKIISICQKDIDFLKSIHKYEDVVWNYGVLCDLLIMNIEDCNDENQNKKYIEQCALFLDEYQKYEEKIGYNIEPINKHLLKYLVVSKQYNKALEALEEARLDMEDVGDNNFLIKEVYENFRLYYESVGDFKKALAYADSISQLKGKADNVNLAVSDTQKDYQWKMAEQDLRHDAEMKLQKTIMYFIIGAFVLLLIFAGYVIRTSIQRRVLNQKLASQNLKLEQQSEELQVQNESLNKKNEQIESQSRKIEVFNEAMVNSLHYAKRIQIAAMPSPSNMQAIFGDFLCIFRPFNIVSGDYMWASQKGNYKILVVADCTGHGVPGALLSILGISMLNEIVATNNLDTIEPGEILNLMRDTLKKTLRQEIKTEDTTRDGMDLALMIFDTQKMILRYAGAYRPIVRIRDGELTVFETSKMPVGAYIKDKDNFESFVTDIKEGDRFYSYSDGITDQFGYRDTDNKVVKFNAKRLRSLLSEIYLLPFDKQQMIIEKTIDNWKTNKEDKSIVYKQTDDNLIVGIKI